MQVAAVLSVHSEGKSCPNAPCASVAIVYEHLVQVSILVLAAMQVAAVPLVHVPVGVLCPNAASPDKPHTEQSSPAVVQSRPVLCEVCAAMLSIKLFHVAPLVSAAAHPQGTVAVAPAFTPRKAFVLTVVGGFALSKVTLSKLAQPSNAEIPMLVTLLGMVILVKAVQF